MIKQAQHFTNLSRGRNDVTDWSLQYFLPFDVWGETVLNSSKLRETYREKWQKFNLLVAYGAKKTAQVRFQSVPALHNAITAPLIDDIPVEVLSRLPEWCMHDKTHRLPHCKNRFDVFFVPVNYDINSYKVKLCALLWDNFGTLSTLHQYKRLKNQPFHCTASFFNLLASHIPKPAPSAFTPPNSSLRFRKTTDLTLAFCAVLFLHSNFAANSGKKR